MKDLRSDRNAHEAEAKKQSTRADEDAKRANEEKKRADTETKRADAEKERADKETHRADEAEEKLAEYSGSPKSQRQTNRATKLPSRQTLSASAWTPRNYSKQNSRCQGPLWCTLRYPSFHRLACQQEAQG
jgi:outer membrane biosynthesis protein TonB